MSLNFLRREQPRSGRSRFSTYTREVCISLCRVPRTKHACNPGKCHHGYVKPTFEVNEPVGIRAWRHVLGGPASRSLNPGMLSVRDGPQAGIRRCVLRTPDGARRAGRGAGDGDAADYVCWEDEEAELDGDGEYWAVGAPRGRLVLVRCSHVRSYIGTCCAQRG